jgi:hypothetical protein
MAGGSLADDGCPEELAVNRIMTYSITFSARTTIAGDREIEFPSSAKG